MKKLTAIVIGYGSRGSKYANYACEHPEELEIVAVADASANRRETAKNNHSLSDEQVYDDWKELALLPKMADFAIIATQDNLHYRPALAMIEKGYHLLLEKPMAPTPQECQKIALAAQKKGVKVIVCHVLRFTKFWATLKDILDNGTIGEIVSVIHTEGVGHLHQSHSFVRGHWRNSKESSPMILAKSCHDMDLLQWLIGKNCKKIQSFGSLTHFTNKNKPQGAPSYCAEGCPVGDTCFYNAMRFYYDDKENHWRRVVTNTLTPPSDEQVLEALSSGPYGRCVYECDNDVVDHQVVNMEFEDGCTVSFSMNAFNKGNRDMRVFGTKGELTADMETGKIKIYSFETKEYSEIDVGKLGVTIDSGHGGGDTGIMKDLIKYLNGDSSSKSICDVEISCSNHLLAFAAEEARIKKKIIDIDNYSDNL